MVLRFTVAGQPVGKGCPRFTVAGGGQEPLPPLRLQGIKSLSKLSAYPQIISEAPEKSGCLLAEARAN
jgi:hypothetical protein